MPCSAVCCSAAVGAWSGKLYGLVQDLTPGDGAIDGLALGYADEQKQTDANGNLLKLTWQFQVNPTKHRACFIQKAFTVRYLKGALSFTQPLRMR